MLPKYAYPSLRFIWLILAGMAVALAACTSEPEGLSAPQQPPGVLSSPTATATSPPSTHPPPPDRNGHTPAHCHPRSHGHRSHPTATLTPAPTATPNPTPQPTGERGLSRGHVPQRLLAVMFDNHPQAYPQAGLNRAVLVFEALAEYGITRYMGVFAPGAAPDAAVIGPVRSARTYFVQWAMGLGAVFVHAGGSPEGLSLAESAPEIANMDALHRAAQDYFYRNTSREAPHNLYTTGELLQTFVADTGAEANESDLAEQGFLFKHDAPADQRPANQRLDYFYTFQGGVTESLTWEYDPQTNGYLRLRRDSPHIDEENGEQVWFKNLVVMEVEEVPIPGDPEKRLDLHVVGEGRARVFLDGMQREVRWRKPTAAAPLRWYDAQNHEIELNAGPVWVAAIQTFDNLSVGE
ncbi:MAG: DUF3048 domain-containing protein [Chloroflexaceae bacterium]|nr:DUF3048 domain-containing protein [Chloroflexaceae bacterium]